MKTYIDIDNWNRKEHFEFFNTFQDPYFGVTVDIDFAKTYAKAKADKASFFLYSFYEIMRAVNQTEAFKYRIHDDNKVVCYDVIQASTTIGRVDGTFGFGYFEYDNDIKIFVERGIETMAYVKEGKGLMQTDKTNGDDLVHFSPVPWIQFTDMKHAVSFNSKDSIPKISTGMLHQERDRMLMPVSISVNHALMDGLHVSQYIETLTRNINNVHEL